MEVYIPNEKRRRRRSPLIPAAFFLPLIAVFFFFSAAKPVVQNTAAYRGKIALTQLLQETVLEILPEETVYADFVTLRFDDAQRVTAIETDSAALSRLQATLAKTVNERLDAWEGAKSSVALGTLSGNWFFIGRGPKLTLYTTSTSAVSTEIRHRFDSAGINQTRHTVELVLSVDAQTLLVGIRAPFVVTTSVPVSDTIIVGVTPQMFAQMASGTGTENEKKSVLPD